MIKMAVITGVLIAAGYYYIMSTSFTIAMNQTNQLKNQYAQAYEQIDQMTAEADQVSR